MAPIDVAARARQQAKLVKAAEKRHPVATPQETAQADRLKRAQAGEVLPDTVSSRLVGVKRKALDTGTVAAVQLHDQDFFELTDIADRRGGPRLEPKPRPLSHPSRFGINPSKNAAKSQRRESAILALMASEGRQSESVHSAYADASFESQLAVLSESLRRLRDHGENLSGTREKLDRLHNNVGARLRVLEPLLDDKIVAAMKAVANALINKPSVLKTKSKSAYEHALGLFIESFRAPGHENLRVRLAEENDVLQALMMESRFVEAILPKNFAALNGEDSAYRETCRSRALLIALNADCHNEDRNTNSVRKWDIPTDGEEGREFNRRWKIWELPLGEMPSVFGPSKNIITRHP